MKSNLFLLGNFRATHKVDFVTIAVFSQPKELLCEAKFRAKNLQRKNKPILEAFLCGNSQELAPVLLVPDKGELG